MPHGGHDIRVFGEQKPPFSSNDLLPNEHRVVTRGTKNKLRADLQLPLQKSRQTGGTFSIRPSDFAVANGDGFHDVVV